MHFKHIFLILISFGTFILPHTLNASDFEWRLNLNLRAQSDPYGYRYGLVERFGMMEPDMMLILDRVYEPADAYMIFRYAELSGRHPEYVLRIYHERRHHGWRDIALFLGIRLDRDDFIVLRERHDMRSVYFEYNNRRKERYEERYAPVIVKRYYVQEQKRHYAPPQKHYKSEIQRHEQARHKSAPVVHVRNKAHSKVERQEPKRDAPQHQDKRDDDKRHH